MDLKNVWMKISVFYNGGRPLLMCILAMRGMIMREL